MTSDPDFKVTIFFYIEYLRNDTRSSHSYYRTSAECNIILSKYWKLYCCKQQPQHPSLDAILIRQWPSVKHDATTMKKIQQLNYLFIHRWHWHRLLAFISGNDDVVMKVLEVGKLHTIKHSSPLSTSSQWRIVLRLAIWLRFLDMLPAAIVDVSGCRQPSVGRRALWARVYL